MKKIIVLGLLILLFLPSPFSSAAVCVDSASGLDEKKLEMPQILRELPVMLSVDSALVTAAITIRAIDDKLKLEGAVWTFGSILVIGHVDITCEFKKLTIIW